MKSLYSPLAFAFRSSHEQLNPWHRILGRIIYFLLFLHATWYLNFFVMAGVLSQRLVAPVVIIGILAFSLLTVIATTALESMRRWSYRVFFVLHLLIGITLMPLLFFHAKPLRIYTGEALALFIFDIICRRLDTVSGFATVTSIPHTKLLQIKIPVPQAKIARFRAAPGQHVYLSIPPESTPAKNPASIHDLLYNARSPHAQWPNNKSSPHSRQSPESETTTQYRRSIRQLPPLP
jgi:K+ transporter